MQIVRLKIGQEHHLEYKLPQGKHVLINRQFFYMQRTTQKQTKQNKTTITPE